MDCCEHVHCSSVTAASCTMPIIECEPCAGLLSHVHRVSTHALTTGTVKAKEKAVIFFCETLPVFPVLSLSALAGELVKNILPSVNGKGQT